MKIKSSIVVKNHIKSLIIFYADDQGGFTIGTFDFEYWSSLDSKYIIVTLEAESKTKAEKEFKNMHPHKKYRILDPLDD